MSGEVWGLLHAAAGRRVLHGTGSLPKLTQLSAPKVGSCAAGRQGVKTGLLERTPPPRAPFRQPRPAPVQQLPAPEQPAPSPAAAQPTIAEQEGPARATRNSRAPGSGHTRPPPPPQRAAVARRRRARTPSNRWPPSAALQPLRIARCRRASAHNGRPADRPQGAHKAVLQLRSNPQRHRGRRRDQGPCGEVQPHHDPGYRR